MTTTTEMNDGDMDSSQAYAYTNGLTGQLPVKCSNSRASYQNPAQIQAWAASAAGGLADAQQTLEVQNGAAFPSDGPWTSVSPQISGCLTHSSSSDGSDTWNSVPTQQSHGSMFNDHSNGVHDAHVGKSGNGTGLTMTQGLGYGLSADTDGNDYTMDFDYTLDPQPYPSPTEDDMFVPVPTNNQPCAPGDDPNVLNHCQGWSAQVNSQEMHTGLVENKYFNGWTTASVDPSVSSRSSHHSDTPLSSPQDHWDDTILGMPLPNAIESNSMVPPLVPFSDVQRFEWV